MSERKAVTKSIDVFDMIVYEIDGGPYDLLIKRLGELVEKIPAECRSSLRWEVYGGEGAEINLKYQVPETDAEMEARINRDARSAADQKDRDLKQLAALKAKYES